MMFQNCHCTCILIGFSRDISSMLSKEWRKLSDSEKKQLQNEAKVKAEYQKQQHPDCWKRKHARRDHR